MSEQEDKSEYEKRIEKLDKMIDQGCDYIGGQFFVAIGLGEMRKRWDHIDSHALAEVDASIQYLTEVREEIKRIIESK